MIRTALESTVSVAKQNAHGIRNSFQNNQVRTVVAIHIPDPKRDGPTSRRVVRMCLEGPITISEQHSQSIVSFQRRQIEPSIAVEVSSDQAGEIQGRAGVFPDDYVSLILKRAIPVSEQDADATIITGGWIAIVGNG
jgi:hypothetical protein